MQCPSKVLERSDPAAWPSRMTKPSPFRYFKTSPENIRLAVMLYIRYPLSLRNVQDLLHERGIEISHETVRFWWKWVRPDVRRRNPAQTRGADALAGPLALAPRRGLREDQRRHTLPLWAPLAGGSLCGSTSPSGSSVSK